MNNEPVVDIVIPLYNEEKVLKPSVERLVGFLESSRFPYRYTITLANNASTDTSATVAADLSRKFPQVKVLDLKKKGKGYAVRTAWERSQGDILAFMDADLSSDLDFFRPLVDEVVENGADLSIGNRLGVGSRVYSKRATRKIASRVYNFMARVLLGTPFDDHQCGFKAMRKESFRTIAPELAEDGFVFDSEWLAVSKRHGLKIKSIDIVWHDTNESKVSLFGDSLGMFADLFRLHNRLK